jgi:hypothetical protein
LHQLLKVFAVESKIETPQSKSATAVLGGLMPGAAGSKFVGGKGKLLRSQTLAVLPPQTSGDEQVPHGGKTPPQPSTIVPQFLL